MPLSESEKRSLAVQYIGDYFPDATPEQTEQAIEFAVFHFADDYSPIKTEQKDPKALGSGATFRQYVIYMARNATNKEPIGIDAAELDTLLRKVLTM